MSEVRRCDTQIKDVQVLTEALVACGVPRDQIFTGEKRAVSDGVLDHDVDIFVPASAAKSSSDVGFVKNSNGSYTAIVSGRDNAGLAGTIRTRKLRQCYAKARIMKTIDECMSRGEIVKDQRMSNGKIGIRLKVPAY